MHKGFDELRAALAAAAELVEQGAQYTHYKNPDSRYQVKEFNIDEGTDEIVVVYFPKEAPDIQFIRPLESFVALVDGMSRFTKVL